MTKEAHFRCDIFKIGSVLAAWRLFVEPLSFHPLHRGLQPSRRSSPTNGTRWARMNQVSRHYPGFWHLSNLPLWKISVDVSVLLHQLDNGGLYIGLTHIWTRSTTLCLLFHLYLSWESFLWNCARLFNIGQVWWHCCLVFCIDQIVVCLCLGSHVEISLGWKLMLEALGHIDTLSWWELQC